MDNETLLSSLQQAPSSNCKILLSFPLNGNQPRPCITLYLSYELLIQIQIAFLVERFVG